MAISAIWTAYSADGLSAAMAVPPADAADHFYLALLAFADDQFAAAAEQAAQAAALAPGRLLYREAATYLARVASEGKTNVYVSGEAFGEFIRGGGNVPLYQALNNALAVAYDDYTRLDLLDIGVGDGLALLPALPRSLARLDLVEPAVGMLGNTSAALTELGVPHHPFAETIQEFMRHANGPWDIIQATFSMHSLPPAERAEVLPWLRAHGQRLLIAEFDVPDLGDQLGPARVQHFAERYDHGLAEYRFDGDLVAQGFLMPVFFGYFDRTSARSTYEQPIELWEFELRDAGFEEVERRHLYDYWWAPAYLLDAH